MSHGSNQFRTRRLGWGRGLTIVVTLLAMVASACSSSSGNSSGGNGDGDATDTSFDGLLSRVPAPTFADAGDDLVIIYTDVARASALAGVTPPRGDDEDAVANWGSAISGARRDEGAADVAVAGLPPSENNQSFWLMEGEFGFGLPSISAGITVSAPPQGLSVLAGDFDSDRIDELAGPRNAAGVWRIGTGEDFAPNTDDITPMRPIGRPRTLALGEDGILFFGLDGQAVRAALDGADTSLNEGPFGEVARALDEAGAYSAMVFAPRTDPGNPLSPFDAIGMGLVSADGATSGVLVYSHATEADALANGDILQRLFSGGIQFRTGEPWSDLFAEATVTTVEGLLTVAFTLAPDRDPGVVWSVLVSEPINAYGL